MYLEPSMHCQCLITQSWKQDLHFLILLVVTHLKCFGAHGDDFFLLWECHHSWWWSYQRRFWLKLSHGLSVIPLAKSFGNNSKTVHIKLSDNSTTAFRLFHRLHWRHLTHPLHTEQSCIYWLYERAYFCVKRSTLSSKTSAHPLTNYNNMRQNNTRQLKERFVALFIVQIR